MRVAVAQVSELVTRAPAGATIDVLGLSHGKGKRTDAAARGVEQTVFLDYRNDPGTASDLTKAERNILHNLQALVGKVSFCADLVIFPEMSLTGYSIGEGAIRELAQARNSALMREVGKLAARMGIILCIGYPERPCDSSEIIYNAFAVFGEDGNLLHHYRKTHLFGEYEKRIFSAGVEQDLHVASFSNGIRFGTLICMDCEYFEPARILAVQGAQLILLPTALATGPVESMTPMATINTRAMENHVFVCYSNFIGPACGEGHPSFVGRSAIVGPDGLDLVRASGPEIFHRLGAEGGHFTCEMLHSVIEPMVFNTDIRRNPYLLERKPNVYGKLCDASLPGGGSTIASSMVVAVAQIAETLGGEESDEECLQLTRKHALTARNQGAELVLFPELSLIGYSIGKRAIEQRAQQRSGNLIRGVASIAKELRIIVAVGYAERGCDEGEEDKIYNALAVLDETGSLIHHYRKTHLGDDYERSVFTPGDESELSRVAVLRSGLKLAAVICMDSEFPETIRLLALHGAQLVLVSTALVGGPQESCLPLRVIPTRALENHVHICYANYNGLANPGSEVNKSPYVGRSAIIGPNGYDLARAASWEAHHRERELWDQILVANVEPHCYLADVERNPYLTARRPALYSSLVA